MVEILAQALDVAGDVGLLSFVAYLAQKDVRAGIAKRSELKPSSLERKIDGIATMTSAIVVKTDEVHEWHKPNESGQQTWKNPGLAESIEGLMKQMTKANVTLGRIHDELKRRP